MTTLMPTTNSTGTPAVRDRFPAVNSIPNFAMDPISSQLWAMGRIVGTLPSNAMDPEERRWQLEWSRRNIED